MNSIDENIVQEILLNHLNHKRSLFNKLSLKDVKIKSMKKTDAIIVCLFYLILLCNLLRYLCLIIFFFLI